MTDIRATFKYDGDFRNLESSVSRLSAKVSRLNSEFNSLDAQAVNIQRNLAIPFARNVGAINGFQSSIAGVRSEEERFGEALQKNRLTMRQYFSEARKAYTTQNSMAAKLAKQQVSLMQSQVVQMEKTATGMQKAMVLRPLSLNTNDFQTKMDLANKKFAIFNQMMKQGTTELINFGKNTQWAGRQLTVGLTVPFTIFANTAMQTFRDVDKELTRFAKVYGSTLGGTNKAVVDSMKTEISSIASEFAKQYGIAAKETAALAADIAATGQEGQKLTETLRETTRLSVLGEVDRQEAMKATLALQSAFKVSNEELADSINFLNAVENQTSTTLQDLVEAIPKTGPVIKGLGGDVKDLAVMLTAMREGGVPAAEAANAIKSGLASLVNPTKKASEFAKQFGVDLEGIVQANQGKLMPTMVAFQKSLENLDDFSRQRIIEQIFGKYQFARISALFNNLGKEGSQTMQVLELAGASTKELAGIAESEMSTLTNSLSMRWTRAMESIKTALLPVGEAITKSVIPVLEKVSGFITKMTNAFNDLPDGVQDFIKVATGLSVVAGPLIMIAGLASNFIGYVMKGGLGIVNLGRRMAGMKVDKFEMLDAEAIAATKGINTVSGAFATQEVALRKLNVELQKYMLMLREQKNVTPNAFATTPATPKPVTYTFGPKGSIPVRRNSGGTIGGTGNKDTVPALLTPGEFVINKKATKENLPILRAINNGSIAKFSGGDQVTRQGKAQNTINKLTGGKLKDPKEYTEKEKKAIKAEKKRARNAIFGFINEERKQITRIYNNVVKEYAPLKFTGLDYFLRYDQSHIGSAKARKEQEEQEGSKKKWNYKGDLILDSAMINNRVNSANAHPINANELSAISDNIQKNLRSGGSHVNINNLIVERFIKRRRYGVGKKFYNDLMDENFLYMNLVGLGQKDITERQSTKVNESLGQQVGKNGKRRGIGVLPFGPIKGAKPLATGGIIDGTGNKDTVPAMLTPGEFVINKKATKQYLPFLRAINSGGLRGYSTGDLVDDEETGPYVSAHMKGRLPASSINPNLLQEKARLNYEYLSDVMKRAGLAIEDFIRPVSNLVRRLPSTTNAALNRGGVEASTLISNLSENRNHQGWARSLLAGGASTEDIKSGRYLAMQQQMDDALMLKIKQSGLQRISDEHLYKMTEEVIASMKAMGGEQRQFAEILDRAGNQVSQLRIDHPERILSTVESKLGPEVAASLVGSDKPLRIDDKGRQRGNPLRMSGTLTRIKQYFGERKWLKGIENPVVGGMQPTSGTVASSVSNVASAIATTNPEIENAKKQVERSNRAVDGITREVAKYDTQLTNLAGAEEETKKQLKAVQEKRRSLVGMKKRDRRIADEILRATETDLVNARKEQNELKRKLEAKKRNAELALQNATMAHREAEFAWTAARGGTTATQGGVVGAVGMQPKSDGGQDKGPSRMQRLGDKASGAMMTAMTVQSLGYMSESANKVINDFKVFGVSLSDATTALMALTVAAQLASAGGGAKNKLGQWGERLTAAGKVGRGAGEAANVGKLAKFGKAAGGIRMAALGAGRALSMLGGPIGMGIAAAVTIGVVALNKYNNHLKKIDDQSRSAFISVGDLAKQMGVELKPLGKSLGNINDELQKLNDKLESAGEKKPIPLDQNSINAVLQAYKNLIEKIKNEQNDALISQDLVSAYDNLIMRGFPEDRAKQIIKEIAKAAGKENIILNVSTKITSTSAEESVSNIVEGAKGLLQSNLNKSFFGNMWNQINTGNWGNVVADSFDAQKEATANVGKFQGAIDAMVAAAKGGSVEAGNGLMQMYSAVVNNKDAMDAYRGSISRGFSEVFAGNTSLIDSFNNASDKQKALAMSVISFGPAAVEAFNKAYIATNNFSDAQAQAISMATQAAEDSAINDVQANILKNIDDYYNGTNGLITNKNKEIRINNNLIKSEESAEAAKQKSYDKELEALQDSRDAKQKAADAAIEGINRQKEAAEEAYNAEKKKSDKYIESLEKEKQGISDRADAYKESLKRQADAQNFYSKQRESAISAMSSLAGGDVAGFLTAREQMAQDASAYSSEQFMTAIDDETKARTDAVDKRITAERDLQTARDEAHSKAMQNFDDQIEAQNNVVKGLDDEIARVNKLKEDSSRRSRDYIDGKNSENAKIRESITVLNEEKSTAVKNVNEILKMAKEGKIDIANVPKELEKLLPAPITSLIKATGGTIDDQLNTAINKNIKTVADALGIPVNTLKSYVALGEKMNRKYQYYDPRTGQTTSGGFVLSEKKREDLRKQRDEQIGVGGYATGGYVRGAGTSTSDSIPARLSNGEYVINAAAVAKYGVPFFERLNNSAMASYEDTNAGGATGIMQKTSGNIMGNIANGIVSAISNSIASKLGTIMQGTQSMMLDLQKDIGKTAWPIQGFNTVTDGLYYPRGGRHRDGWTNPTLRGPYTGVNDIGGGVGRPIYAYAGGKVVENKAGSHYYPGYMVLQHANGGMTRYAHLNPSSMNAKVGSKVSAGDQIAALGDPSAAGMGSHLHFAWTGIPSLKQREAGGKVPWLKNGAMIKGNNIPSLLHDGELVMPKPLAKTLINGLESPLFQTPDRSRGFSPRSIGGNTTEVESSTTNISVTINAGNISDPELIANLAADRIAREMKRRNHVR